MIQLTGRSFTSKVPRFLQKIERMEAKEQLKDKHTITLGQSNKAKPKNFGKAVKGRDMLPETPYINFMDATNKVFLGETFSSRTLFLKGDPI